MMGLQNPSGLVGIHMNILMMKPTEQEKAHADATELKILADLQHYKEEWSGYSKEQSTRLQTIGTALADSPAGQAAWIYEKFHDWTDKSGNPEDVLSQDEILDNIMLYWLPNTAAASARTYWESFTEEGLNPPPCTVPTAISMFPKELQRTSRRWADKRFTKLVYFNELKKGGHFAAFEQPGFFTEEVRAGLWPVR